jgi:hypothetical protein
LTCDEHDDIEATVAAYVLSAADEKEASMAAAHLDRCASCRVLARRLSRVAAAIPLSAEEVKPPERLRARVLHSASVASTSKGLSAQESGEPRSSRLGRDGRRARRYSVPAMVAVLVLLTAVASGLGAWNVSLTRELARQSNLNRQLAERNAQLSRVNDALNQGPRYHTLSGEGQLGGARGSIVSLRQEPVTIIYFSGLPPPAPGKVYELWLTDTAGQRARGPVFTPDRGGTARVWLDRKLDGITRLGVTVEQGPSGVDAPTQPSQLKGQIA